MKRALVIPLLIVLATMATYARVMSCDFTSWDDPDTIAANPRLKPPTLARVSHYWRHEAGGLYIPVTYSYWAVLAGTIGGEWRDGEYVLNPRAFHAGSIVLHTISALLVFTILRRLIPSDAAAAVGALLFALHPVQVESVAWASAAKDVLAGMFAVGTVDQFLRFVAKREQPDTDARMRATWHYAAAVALLTLAILAKPSAVVAPVIGCLLAWARFKPSVRSLLTWTAPLLVLSLACAIWSRAAQAQFEPTDTPLWTRPLIAADAIAFYLCKLVWPMHLTIIYGRTPGAVVESGAIYWTWIVPVITATLAWLARRWTRWVFVGFLVLVIALLPVLGFARFMFQIHSTVADHYLYLPMLGIALVATGLVALRPNVIVIGITGIVLLALAARSFDQIRHWRDGEALFARVLERNPNSAFARGGLGRALAEHGRLDEAIEQFRAAVKLAPRSRAAHAYLAQAYLLDGQYDRAIIEARVALELARPNEDTNWEQFILNQAVEAQRRHEQPQRPTTQP